MLLRSAYLCKTMFSDKLRLQLKIGGAFTFSEKLFSFCKQLQTLRLKKVQENHSSDFRENPSSGNSTWKTVIWNFKSWSKPLIWITVKFEQFRSQMPLQEKPDSNLHSEGDRIHRAWRREIGPVGSDYLAERKMLQNLVRISTKKYLLGSLEFSLLFLFWISFTFSDVYCKQCGERTGTLQVGRSLFTSISFFSPLYIFQTPSDRERINSSLYNSLFLSLGAPPRRF